jgi:hypothetical protein
VQTLDGWRLSIDGRVLFKTPRARRREVVGPVDRRRPFRWARSVELLAAEGLAAEVFPQMPARMSPGTARFHEAVMNRTLTHSGNSTLARHVYNGVVKEDAPRGSVGETDPVQ